ncbi:MAG: hypothetical protein R2688_07975 [Fimbriimonadaceae bacterium]
MSVLKSESPKPFDYALRVMFLVALLMIAWVITKHKQVTQETQQNMDHLLKIAKSK